MVQFSENKLRCPRTWWEWLFPRVSTSTKKLGVFNHFQGPEEVGFGSFSSPKDDNGPNTARRPAGKNLREPGDSFDSESLVVLKVQG